MTKAIRIKVRIHLFPTSALSVSGYQGQRKTILNLSRISSAPLKFIFNFKTSYVGIIYRKNTFVNIKILFGNEEDFLNYFSTVSNAFFFARMKRGTRTRIPTTDAKRNILVEGTSFSTPYSTIVRFEI